MMIPLIKPQAMHDQQCFQLKEPADFIMEVRALLAANSPAKISDPHLSLEWFLLLAETAMPAGAQLSLCRASCSAARTPSYLPLLTLPDKPEKIFSLSNFYTPLFGMVDEVHADHRQLENLTRQLKASRQKCSELYFSPMDPASPSFSQLRCACQKSGWLVDDYFNFGNWYLPVDSNATTYLAARPAKLRNTLRRAEKRLAQMPGYKLQIVQGGNSGLDEAIAAFVNVYNRSWKNPEPFPQFIPGLCQLAAAKGWLRLGVLYLGDKPVAAQLWLVAEGKTHIVKLAYDKDYAYTSAGTVLSAALFRHVIDVDRSIEIDYLIGDDPYKQDWMTQRRERRGIVAFNIYRWRGLLAALRHFAGKVRRWGRRLVSSIH
ncbi:MAG: GNAT family N-acetyltransferase [Azonexus sp.]|nr:GNAT family N-acetyltransferase [Azonexus sp.]